MTWTHEQGQHITNIREFVEHTRSAPLNDADQLTIISGDERKGKSTLAFGVIHKIEPDFDLERCTFTASDFIAACNTAPKGSCVWLDEAISGGFNREAMSAENRALAKYLTVAGERNLLMFVLWPNWRWLDPMLRDHRAHFHFFVKRRGMADLDYPFKGKHQSAPYWQRLREIPFPQQRGPKWDEYIRRKREFVDETGRDYGRSELQTLAEVRAEISHEIREQVRPWCVQLAGEAREIAKTFHPKIIAERDE